MLNYEDLGSNEVIAEGNYELRIEKAEKKETLSGSKYINLWFRIRKDVEQPRGGAIVFHKIWAKRGTEDYSPYDIKAILRSQPEDKRQKTFDDNDDLIQYLNGLYCCGKVIINPANEYSDDESNDINMNSLKWTKFPPQDVSSQLASSEPKKPESYKVEISDEDLPF